jgi:hypothetical protein
MLILYNVLMKGLLYFIICILLLSILSIIEILPKVESVGFKVIVRLVNHGEERIKLCIYSPLQNLPCDTVSLENSGTPFESKTWEFKTGSVPIGAYFTICVTNLDIDKRNCYQYKNTVGEDPELVQIEVPSSRPPPPGPSTSIATFIPFIVGIIVTTVVLVGILFLVKERRKLKNIMPDREKD